jgi:hypothetical protein
VTPGEHKALSSNPNILRGKKGRKGGKEGGREGGRERRKGGRNQSTER